MDAGPPRPRPWRAPWEGTQRRHEGRHEDGARPLPSRARHRIESRTASEPSNRPVAGLARRPRPGRRPHVESNQQSELAALVIHEDRRRGVADGRDVRQRNDPSRRPGNLQVAELGGGETRGEQEPDGDAHRPVVGDPHRRRKTEWLREVQCSRGERIRTSDILLPKSRETIAMRSSESQAMVIPYDVETNKSIALRQTAAFSKDFAPILLPEKALSLRRQKDRERLLSVAEVARTLGVCDATVYKLCGRGLLGHVRILNAIRVPPASVDAFVASQPRSPGNLRG